MSQELFGITVPNRAQLFLRNNYTVFCTNGTVAPWSVNPNFPWSRSSAAKCEQEKEPPKTPHIQITFQHLLTYRWLIHYQCHCTRT